MLTTFHLFMSGPIALAKQEKRRDTDVFLSVSPRESLDSVCSAAQCFRARYCGGTSVSVGLNFGGVCFSLRLSFGGVIILGGF